MLISSLAPLFRFAITCSGFTSSNSVGTVEVGAGDNGRAGHRQRRHRVGGADAGVAEHKTLHVEHDVGDVLADALDRRELVLDTLDAHRRRGSALQRGQQHAAHAVAERVAEAALERLNDVARYAVVDLLDRDLGPHELSHQAASLAK